MISFTVILRGVHNDLKPPEGIRHISLEKTFEMQCLPRIGENLNCPSPLGKVERIHHNLDNGKITIIFEECSLDSTFQIFSQDDTWNIESYTKREEAKFRQLCKEYQKIKKPRDRLKFSKRLRLQET